MNKLYIALALSLVAIAINSNFPSIKDSNNDVKIKKVSIVKHQDIGIKNNEIVSDSLLTQEGDNSENKRIEKDKVINKKNNITEYFSLEKNYLDSKSINIIKTQGATQKGNIEKDKAINTSGIQDTTKQIKNKKSIISSILESYRLGDFSNLEILQEQLTEFNTAELAEELLDAVFSDPETSYEISQLPNAIKYAIKKAISLVDDRDYIASKLTSIYQNATDNDVKYRIAKFAYPEAYAMIAVAAYNQGDTDIFTDMSQNLIRTDNEHAIDGLMILARKIDTSSIDTVTEIAKKWSDYNLSEDTASLVEDYLSNGVSTPKERIIAVAILSNNEKKDKILEKAWMHEENDLVKTYINQYRYSNVKNKYE